MKIYTTYGTYGFLNQIRINNEDRQLFVFSTADNSVIIEEPSNPSILKHPTTYETITAYNELNSNHFYSAIFIPTAENYAYQLEKKLAQLTLDFSSFGGFKSYRFLKPVEGTTYKIYFGFADRQSYEDFKTSELFQQHFSKSALSQFFGASSQHSSYFERYLYPVKD